MEVLLEVETHSGGGGGGGGNFDRTIIFDYVEIRCRTFCEEAR